MPADRRPGRAQQRFRDRGADPDRHRRLRPVAGADRLHPDRGPGLSAGRRAIARRRRARPHPDACSTGSARSPARQPGVDQVITIAGISALDNSSSLANAGVAYIDPEGLERARHGRGPALAVRRPEREAVGDRGSADPGDPAAADPGHRQRRRLCHAGRAARRQFRFRQAAGHHRRDRRQCADAKRVAARQFVVPLDGAAIRRRGRPRSRRRRCMSRPTRSSRRCRPIWARPTSTSSTSSAAPSRSMPRRMRSSA